MAIKIKIGIILLFFMAVTALTGQSHLELEKQRVDSIYQKNIQKSYIDGVYIPKDMDEAIAEIKRLSPPSGLEKFKNAPSEMVVKKLHFGLGKWIAKQWHFVDGSRYSNYLKSLGVSRVNDMIHFTLESLHMDLNGQDLMIEQRAKAIAEKRKKENIERLSGGKVLSN